DKTAPAGRTGKRRFSMTRSKLTGLLLGVLAVALAGCQSKPQFAPVEGTITKEGKPLAGVLVNFYPHPRNRRPPSPSTPTDEAGHYRLRSSWGGDDGAVVGPHRVCILDIRNGRRGLFGRLPKNLANVKEVQKEGSPLAVFSDLGGQRWQSTRF